MTKSTVNNDVEPNTIDLAAGRRAFMQCIGLGAGAMAIGAAGTRSASALDYLPKDIDVLNFALNLEYLEANFYLTAVTGSGLADSLRIGGQGQTPGQLSGGHAVTFSDPLVKAYAQEIANDEKNHVTFLRTALGSAAVAMPNINIGSAFTTAARAAGLISSTQTFDAYANDTTFLLASYIFEDVGVTAYHGAAKFLTDNVTYLEAAAGILAVEAYHAGLIRTVLFAMGKSRETQLISNLRAALSCANDDAGVGTTSAPNIVLTDANSIAYSRTTDQVLNVVYGAQGTNKGLFFPHGLNGAIKASSTTCSK